MYKRQGLGNRFQQLNQRVPPLLVSELFRQIVCQGLLRVECFRRFFCILHDPVSYTHLDVYKRQVNKYAPEEVVPVKREASQGPAPVPVNILAAITAAVNVVTQGKGKITKVEKL